MKRICILADFHCGHAAGLTPVKISHSQVDAHKLARYRAEVWAWYTTNVKKYGPYDAVVFNGDAIDGRGERSGGTELIETNRQLQCQMAIECVEVAITKRTATRLFTYGTAYHTGQEEDWEQSIASTLRGKIGSHEWLDVNGLVFDFKHHIGSSSIPHGRHTAVSRDKLWSDMWSAREDTPKSDIIVRSHVHYHQFCGGPGWLGLTTPALQGYATKYGARRCSGTVDIGFVVFEVDEKGNYQWQAHTVKPKTLRTRALKA